MRARQACSVDTGPDFPIRLALRPEAVCLHLLSAREFGRARCSLYACQSDRWQSGLAELTVDISGTIDDLSAVAACVLY
jgi:hypothetical protein